MIADIIKEYGMLPAKSRVLCAVSGGADSVCMLHLLKGLEEELQIRVFCAHYEHGLRGEESLRDMAFVQELCRSWGIECRVGQGDVRAYAQKHGMSTEEAARELRYTFLHETARGLSCDRIATAHNADDNAETVIFNLTRGSGAKGLSGIPPVRGNIIRPLLWTGRQEIEAYLEANAIPYVTDSSNLTDDYSRNIIRHRVMPVLREINPALAGSVLKTGQLLRQDEEYLSTEAERFIRENTDEGGLDAAALCALPDAVAGRVIRGLWARPLSFEHVKSVLEFAGGSGLGRLDIPGGSLYREQGRLTVNKPETLRLEERRLIPGEVLEIPEAGLRIVSSVTDYPEEINNKFKTYLFKYESICGTILCVSRRDGDRMAPAGRNCTKSLKQLFLEKKLTQAQRDLTPVLRDDRGIIGVIGIAVASRCKAEPGDKVLRVDVEKI